MSIFSDRMVFADTAIYSRLAEIATYTNTSTSAVSVCSIVVDRNLSKYGDELEVAGKTAVVSVRAAQVADIPRRKDLFTITATSEVFVVDTVIQSDGDEHRCLVA